MVLVDCHDDVRAPNLHVQPGWAIVRQPRTCPKASSAGLYFRRGCRRSAQGTTPMLPSQSRSCISPASQFATACPTARPSTDGARIQVSPGYMLSPPPLRLASVEAAGLDETVRRDASAVSMRTRVPELPGAQRVVGLAERAPLEHPVLGHAPRRRGRARPELATGRRENSPLRTLPWPSCRGPSTGSPFEKVSIRRVPSRLTLRPSTSAPRWKRPSMRVTREP